MSPSAAVYLAVFGAIGDVVAIAALLWWIASRTRRERAASEIVGRAEQQAVQLRQQAAREADSLKREAESLKKEAELEARERAHGLVADAEAKARARQQEISGLEQGLADRTRTLAERLAATATPDTELPTRCPPAADAHQPRA